ncbi:MAG: hypothetical protein AB7F31_01100 [Parachlamydiales bacterium]
MSMTFEEMVHHDAKLRWGIEQGIGVAAVASAGMNLPFAILIGMRRSTLLLATITNVGTTLAGYFAIDRLDHYTPDCDLSSRGRGRW